MRIGNFYVSNDKLYDIKGHHILTTDSDSGQVVLSSYVIDLINLQVQNLKEKENECKTI